MNAWEVKIGEIYLHQGKRVRVLSMNKCTAIFEIELLEEELVYQKKRVIDDHLEEEPRLSREECLILMNGF